MKVRDAITCSSARFFGNPSTFDRGLLASGAVFLGMERTVLEERMQDYSSIYSKSAIELSSNSALEPLFKYFLAVSPSSKVKSRVISADSPALLTSPAAKADETLQFQPVSPQNSVALSKRSVKPRSHDAAPFPVASAHKESASRAFETKCIAKCQALNAAAQALPPGFMEAAQASVRINDLAKRATQLIALENQIHETIEIAFEEAVKDLEAQFGAERNALQKVHHIFLLAASSLYLCSQSFFCRRSTKKNRASHTPTSRSIGAFQQDTLPQSRDHRRRGK
jgi:hypothetical protein